MAESFSPPTVKPSCLSGNPKLQDSRFIIDNLVRSVQLGEDRLDSQLIPCRDETADIVADELGQRLIFHRQFGFRPNAIAKLPLDGREGRLYIRSLMVVFQKLLPVEAEIVERFLEQAADAASRVRLELEECLRLDVLYRLEILFARIRPVCTPSLDRESLARGFHQRRQLRAVAGILVENLNGGHDMGFRATCYVSLHPLRLGDEATMLDVEPSIKLGGRESRGIEGEIRLDFGQRQCTADHQTIEDVEDGLVVEYIEDAVEMRQPADEALIMGFLQESGEAPRRYHAVDLVDGAEQRIAERNRRSAFLDGRFRDGGAEIPEQREKMMAFVNLRGVVQGPVLRVGFPLCPLDRRGLDQLFALSDQQPSCMQMLAGLNRSAADARAGTQRPIITGARHSAIDQGYAIAAVPALRGHHIHAIGSRNPAANDDLLSLDQSRRIHLPPNKLRLLSRQHYYRHENAIGERKNNWKVGIFMTIFCSWLDDQRNLLAKREPRCSASCSRLLSVTNWCERRRQWRWIPARGRGLRFCRLRESRWARGKGESSVLGGRGVLREVVGKDAFRIRVDIAVARIIQLARFHSATGTKRRQFLAVPWRFLCRHLQSMTPCIAHQREVAQIVACYCQRGFSCPRYFLQPLAMLLLRNVHLLNDLELRELAAQQGNGRVCVLCRRHQFLGRHGLRSSR